ncbi:MAG: PIN domain-containing protein [Lachnospiraceae bacterium]|nr:PIN domain-containing protein [Lachnospiraceae bacterium]
MKDEENIHFLVDYENVGESGLDGLEYLESADTLAIFYSASCDKISRKSIDLIMSSGCNFETYRLKKTGKNALDFYIISRAGELLGSGYPGKLVVISKDKGYCAMRDYWMARGIPSQRILIKHTICEGIIASNECSARRNLAMKESAQVSINTEFAKYQERERLRKQMEIVFSGTEYENAVYFFRDGFVRGINRIKSYAGTTLGYGFQHAFRIFENAGIQPPVLLLGSEAENDAIIAADGERCRERMNQIFRVALGWPEHEDSELDREKTVPEKAEAFPLTESQIMRADANNRKAKAILGSIVHSIYLSDEDCIDVTEMLLAAYDYVVRNDAILGFDRQKHSQISQ